MTGQTRASRKADPELLTRLLARDTSLWSKDPAVRSSISQRLGWLDAVSFSRGQLPGIREFTAQITEAGFDSVILMGMGGSSLAPEVFNQCFQRTRRGPRLTVLDTTFPDSVQRATAAAARGQPLFIISSKSGSTAETMALYKHFWQWCQTRYGIRCGDHFVAITDENSALHQLGAANEFREVFLNPSDIGGRYSALSQFGLLPASLVGVDLPQLLDRAQQMIDTPEAMDAAFRLGYLMGSSALAGQDKLTLTFSPQLTPLGPWIEQLVAESTGKDGKGIVPIIGEAELPPDRYPHDRLFVEINLSHEVSKHPDSESRLASLERHGHPVVSISATDMHDLGAEFLRWQIATAIAAAVMGINPFDEPDVNAAKQSTARILQGKPPPVPKSPRDPCVSNFLKCVRPHDYVALLAYLPTDQNWEELLQPLRLRLLRRLNIATSLALGPRYLHSSGQLHKGGKKNGHFIVLTVTGHQDVSIPEENYSFGRLIDAQAQGDLAVLDKCGQKTCHINLGAIEKAAAAIHALSASIDSQP